MSSDPGTIILTPTMSLLLDELVGLVAKRNNESPDDVRRGVELAVISRGLESLQIELGFDGETVGAVTAESERVA